MKRDLAIEQIQKDLRRDMEIRWEAIKKSTSNMLEMLDGMLKCETLEDLAKMKKTMIEVRQHVQSSIQDAEHQTQEKPKFMN